jgi:hypothetical protein
MDCDVLFSGPASNAQSTDPFPPPAPRDCAVKAGLIACSSGEWLSSSIMEQRTPPKETRSAPPIARQKKAPDDKLALLIDQFGDEVESVDAADCGQEVPASGHKG